MCEEGPTEGELVHLDLPKNLEGVSFAPLLVDPDQPWKKAVFMVDGDGGQMVRTRRHSYLELKKGPVTKALYDLEKDPWETINVVDEPACAKVRREMADLLNKGWRAAQPPRPSHTGSIEADVVSPRCDPSSLTATRSLRRP